MKKYLEYLKTSLIITILIVIIEFVFAFLSVSKDLGTVVNVIIAFIPVVILGMCLKEIFKYYSSYKIGLVRFTYILCELLLFFIMIIEYKNEEALDINYTLEISSTHFIMLIPYMLMHIYSNHKMKKRSLNQEELDEEIKKDNRKYIPTGYISVKSYYIHISILTVLILLYLGIVIYGVIIEKMYVIFLGFFVFILFLFLILYIKLKYDRKIIVEFENTLDYETFEKQIDAIKRRDRINIETINYLDILKANYVGISFCPKREEILNNCYKPNEASYLYNYLLIKSLKLNDEERLAYYEDMKYEVLFQTKIYKNLINKEIRSLKMILGKEECLDIEKEFKIIKTTKLSNILCLMTRLKYYFYHQDVENNHKIKEELELILTNLGNHEEIDNMIKSYSL